MAPKALSKAKTSKKTKTPGTKKAASRAKPKPASPARRPAAQARAPVATTKGHPQAPASRAMVHADDEDELMAHGGGGGGFGRCGGRLLSSRLEQNLCHWLGMAGIVHSHAPRHYEVRYEDNRVAAYAPQIVLRGRGREGKSVVIEAVEDPQSPILRKIVAFRAQYGQEFYLIVVASDDVLEQIPLLAFDESCSTTNVNTLIARLAE
ncbi:MAG: hypothetical protein U1E73_04355 [Planctomycetota bacterium]